MEYLKEKAEGYVAQWIMTNPDGVDELNAYWFYSMVGKAIVWSVIKAKRNGPVTLDTIKQYCEWERTRAKPEYFDLVYNQSPLDNDSLQYCIRYFKLMGMITDLKEAEMDSKIKFTENQYNGVSKIIEHVKANTDTAKMYDVIHKFWCAKLNKKPLLSKADKITAQQRAEEELLNRLNK